MTQQKTKRRPKPKIQDLTERDLDLLTTAYNIPEESFLCFGKSYFPLQALGLITDENQITFAGRQFVWERSQQAQGKVQ